MKTKLNAPSLTAYTKEWEMTEEQADIILTVLAERDCGLCINDSEVAVIHNDGTIQDLPYPGMDGVLDTVNFLNITELMNVNSVVRRKEVMTRINAVMPLLEKAKQVGGFCVGQPTVGKLIDMLSAFPKSALVSCCGADLHLFLTADGICLDCESTLER